MSGPNTAAPMISHNNIEHVSTLELPELDPYRTLRRPEEHLKKGIFVAEGEKVVRRLLDSSLVTLSLLLSQEWLERILREPLRRDLENVRIFLASEELLRQIVGYNIHEGIMALGKVPPATSIEDLPAPHLLVALDGLRSSENVGIIVRNCAALGVDALLVGERSCSPWVRRAVRNSMGAVFTLPLLHVPSLPEALSYLRHRFETRIIASDPHATSTIYGTEMAGNLCIVLGNEETGVSASVMTVATDRVVIPMHYQTDSLNVASACAVFLFEAKRQRITREPAPREDVAEMK
jgi:tRNA G18 (ribose-2'-O)-methylase SpoU